jgi:hypothetical protein
MASTGAHYTFSTARNQRWIFTEISETWILNPRAEIPMTKLGSWRSCYLGKKNAPVRFENYRPKN